MAYRAGSTQVVEPSRQTAKIWRRCSVLKLGDGADMKLLTSCLIALTGCNLVDSRSVDGGASTTGQQTFVSHRQTVSTGSKQPIESGGRLPTKYIRALMCEFDENPIAAATRFHETPGGRAERAADLKLLKGLGFDRDARDYGLDTLGGRIAAQPGLLIFGLPVQSVEIAGMIGDTNPFYVTTFADKVTVAQVVNAAHLTMDRTSYTKYGTRYYSRRIGDNPSTNLFLNDRGGKNVMLTCRIRSTPD